ncbi:FERM and PDZ domain-containing protein 3 isoform X2 [Polypterus senegalus]|nr:FERM and PDZ domain-containing protein 3 isoform X2 [Polypterus senegalus]
MQEESYDDDMESDSLTPGTARQVRIHRDPTQGFGFVAGSEKPVIVRSVSQGGPSDGKLLPGDQILAINEEAVSDVSRERVIDLVRNCKESILLTVLQPHQSPKSAFISAAKKAKLRSNPPKVRFSEPVSVSNPDHEMLKEDALLLIPNVLKVFLENGQIKSFTFDSRTTVKDVMVSLQDRLSLRYIEHFALVLEFSGSDQNHRLHILQDSQPLTHVVQRTYFQGMKCLFRICFFPKDPADLLRRDPAAFEYLYIQSRNDVIKERLGSDWKSEVTLKLTALHIYITVSAARPNQKISLKNVEKEWGLEPFLPPSLLPLVKEKNVCKSLSQQLKAYQNPPPTGNKVPAIQAKLQYMRVLNELPPFGGLLFNTVGLGDKQPATTLLVGPRHGISHVIDLKTNLTTVLSEFSRVNKIQLFRENQGVARVEVSILEVKPLVLLMEWPDAANFACLIAGYYRLFVDPKKVIFCRTSSQSHMIKADYRNIQPVLRPAPSAQTGRREDALVTDRLSRESTQRSAGQTNPSVDNLCYLHMKEQHQYQQQQKEQKRQIDINENVIPVDESRPRTKSDPTYKCSDPVAAASSPTHESSKTRARAYTLDPVQQAGHFYCDSCKAKLKAAASTAPVGAGLRTQILQQCANACGSREGTVDLISLPPPGSDEEQDDEEGTIKPPPATIAAPPPGFRDNSSDEDDPKRRAAAAAAAAAAASSSVGRRDQSEEVPVTLIDNVATRTVRDHAQELDDALVSTLQALEALAASEDYPHHHHHQPQQTAGLIVLAAITPESSLDSGHETNSSELTDISEMVTAMKQHPSSTYLLAHHINKERIFNRREFSLAIPACTTQAVGGATISMGQLRTGCPAKPLILSKAGPMRITPSQEASPTGDQGKFSDQKNPNDHGQISTEPKTDLKTAVSPSVIKTTEVFPQVSSEPKHASPSEKRKASKELKTSCLTEDGLSPILSLDVKEKALVPVSSETINKASALLSPADINASVKCKQISTTSDPESASKANVTSKLKVAAIDAELLCTCPVRSEGGLQLKDTQTQKVASFHSSSPANDDERFSAKAKSLPLPSSKEVGKGNEASQKSSVGLFVPPLISESTERRERLEAKADASESKSATDAQKCPKTLLQRIESVQPAGSAEAPTDCKKLNLSKSKSQKSAPFLSFRNLLSATFPARMKRETDERQAQLQKVRQYELEFLEELLKPKAAQMELLPQGASPVPAGTPCPCQLRTSPVQKIPGISREQRRSCDCKRICRGMRLPDTPVGSVMEKRGRENIPYKPPLQKQLQQPEEVQRPQSLEIKTSRIRSTSLESRDPQEQSVSCLPACASRSECIGAPQYKKLIRRYSISEADSNERAPLYSESKPVKAKVPEKENEQPRASLSKSKTAVDLTYAQLGDAKRKPVYSIKTEGGRELELFQEGKSGGEEILGLSGEDDDDEEEKCCSFCFCYRKCDSTDESSEKDELSYSIPLQLLPGMQLDAHTLPVVSKTLQVLDADGCSGEEETQSQEIDLRTTGTLESSLSRVKALQGKTFSLPDGFLAAQLDANELLSVLRQCAGNPQGDADPRQQAPRLAEYKQELALRFKEFRASCRRVAGVEKSPTRMLLAVTASFQVLCGLIETFIKLVCVVRSESQRQELLKKVEEVALNYTFLLRAAEESMSRTGSLPTPKSSSSQPPPPSVQGSNTVSSQSLSIKPVIKK